MFRRALELLEQSRLLLSQNDDPEISEQTLYGQMADMYLGLHETDKGIELFKQNNAGGMYNHHIGNVLAVSGRTEEAAPFLSEGFAKILSNLCDTISGYTNVFLSRGEYNSARVILDLVVEFFSGLREDGKPNFLDKVNSALLAALAYAQFMSQQEEESRSSLQKAKEHAELFDASPSYDESDIRFIDRIEGASAHDEMGSTAMDAINNVVNGCENEAFSALWISVTKGE